MAYVIACVISLAVGIWFGWQVLPRSYFNAGFIVLCGVACSTTHAGGVITVERVIDGDTFVLDDGRRIRLHGVDTPEIRQPHGGDAAVTAWNLVKRKPIELRNVQDAAWDRQSAVVIVAGQDVGEQLLRRGLAYVDDRYVDDAYKQRYKKAFDESVRSRRGIWAVDVTPREYRARKRGDASIGKEAVPAAGLVPEQRSTPQQVFYYRQPIVCTQYG